MFIWQVVFLSVMCNLVSSAVLNNNIDLCNKTFTNIINLIQKSWVAGSSLNRHLAYGATLDLEDFERLKLKHKLRFRPYLVLPKSFDARLKWPYCESLHEIRNQGNCGTCWAMCSAAAMSDRHCIHSYGREKVTYSAEDLFCISGTTCKGGSSILMAHRIWNEAGVVSNETRPYSNYHFNGIDDKYICNNDHFYADENYEDDKHFGAYIYSITDEDTMQAEIYENGPITVSFEAFEDFQCYQHGIYHHTYGNLSGHHAVKLLGWGVEHGEKYWIAANSWGKSWGENGFFRIRRGKNECNIAKGGVTGIPMLN